ncbi:hypothetical protein AZH90_004324 [Salmonella enterica subsp. enterica serovar Legon]|nr:hypothetical protein [Salmonella enterica subsp. enterica serovar Legon]EDW9825388.1 hypothetical protein [Salmonella enterica]EDZ3589440.1 hypothetical protein [Salmonella enterica subsp. enterica serovar Wagenia]
MKRLGKDTLRSMAVFCSIFDKKYDEGASVEELKDIVINVALTMRIRSVNPDATRTYEQYGILMEYLLNYLSCTDDDGIGVEFERFTARRKMGNVNFMTGMRIRDAAEDIDDNFADRIEQILKK